MKKRILALALVLCLAFSMGVTASAVDGGETTTQATVNVTAETANYTIGTPTKLVVNGPVTLTGTGDAFTINANTELVFEEGASLTLNGYDNAFVVSNATLSGGGWVINDGDGMDLFKLNTGGKLNITGNVDLNGKDKTEATASRAIFLPWGTSGQAVTLGENVTLAATNFYRGVETGGASGYTISGAGMETSTFDFSGNDCGMYLSYFDSNVNFKNCKLEVSNCPTSGIFMRQDNASLNGLYIDEVYINCVNDLDLEQADIAVRFHTVQFAITDSVINIENAWNTGLWICDGWEKGLTKKISNTTINITNVADAPGDGSLSDYVTTPTNRRKAVTLVPYGEWTISNCEFNIDGGTSEMEGGINIASDLHIDRKNSMNYNEWRVVPGMHGGKITLTDTEINASGIRGAEVGTQIGQWLEIGQNVVINKEKSNDHFTVLCDDVNGYYPVLVFGLIRINLQYDSTGMSDYNKTEKRVSVTGGSYYSADSITGEFAGYVEADSSIPVNATGDLLQMFEVDQEAFTTYATEGAITLEDSSGESYSYSVQDASSDGVRYIWAPAVTVTFKYADGSEETKVVPKGAKFGLTAELPAGNWHSDGTAFTVDTIVSDDIAVNAA